MAERNLIHFDVASLESAICRISPRTGPAIWRGPSILGPDWKLDRSPLLEHWKRGLRRENGGKKREGFISLLFIISGRSIYDRIGRDGTSSLANRNRDTGRRLAAQSSKPRFIFIVYISTLVESVVNFIAGSSPRPTFDKFSSPRMEYEDRCSFPTDRYSPEQFRLLSPANYLSLWGTRVRESC